MTRRWFVLLGCSVLAGAGVMRAVGSGRRTAVSGGRADVMMTTVDETPADAPPGLLLISARAHLPARSIGFQMYWFFEIRQADPASPGRLRAVATQEYLDQWFSVPIGQLVEPTFTERLEYPAGQYNVLVGLRESRPTFNRDGTVAQVHTQICAGSQWLTVR
jgi:hypothetical protein